MDLIVTQTCPNIIPATYSRLVQLDASHVKVAMVFFVQGRGLPIRSGCPCGFTSGSSLLSSRHVF